MAQASAAGASRVSRCSGAARTMELQPGIWKDGLFYPSDAALLRGTCAFVLQRPSHGQHQSLWELWHTFLVLFSAAGDCGHDGREREPSVATLGMSGVWGTLRAVSKEPHASGEPCEHLAGTRAKKKQQVWKIMQCKYTNVVS